MLIIITNSQVSLTSPRILPFFLQVHNLVAIELAYINTKHPDFTDAAQVSASVNSQQVLIYSVCSFQQVVTFFMYMLGEKQKFCKALTIMFHIQTV